MNAKPKMETINDQKREERVAGFIEGLWGVSCNKLPVSYGLTIGAKVNSHHSGLKLSVAASVLIDTIRCY